MIILIGDILTDTIKMVEGLRFESQYIHYSVKRVKLKLVSLKNYLSSAELVKKSASLELGLVSKIDKFGLKFKI